MSNRLAMASWIAGFLGALTVTCLELARPSDVSAYSGDTVPTITAGPTNMVEGIVHIYGASLGEDWSGMSARMSPDYDNTSANEQLNRTLPIYIDWEIDSYNVPGACAPCDPPDPDPVSPPRPLGEEEWFKGNENGFVPTIIQNLSDGSYTTCAQGEGLEEPVNVGLSADGEMTVADIHGGISDDTAIYWVRYVCVGNACEYWVIVLRWNRVQTYQDVDTSTRVDPMPGDLVTGANQIAIRRNNCSTNCVISNIWSEMLITQWVSTDAAGVSPRIVDSSDLGALSTHLGNNVVWGYDSPNGGGPSTRTYHVNFASGDNAIDGSDVAAYANDIGKDCELSKVVSDSERSALMAWFGFAPTDEQVEIVPGQPPVQGWALVDPEQNARAILDPEGYRSQINRAEHLPWSDVKQLYR